MSTWITENVELGGNMDAIFTALFGGATGILGTVVGKVAGFFEAKQKLELTREEFKHELALQELNIQARSAEMESEQIIAEAATFATTRQASYDHDSAYGKPYRWVVTLLRLIRPLLTLSLIVLTGILFFQLGQEGQADIASQVIFLTGMAVSWWFGDRYKGGK